MTIASKRSFWARVASWGIGSASLADKEAFHQHRVALYAKTLTVLVFVLVFIDLAMTLAIFETMESILFVYWIGGYAGLIAPFTVVWFVCARGERPTWALNLMEGGCTFIACAICSFGIVTLHYGWPENPIGYLSVPVIFMGLVLFLVMRAAIVPSSTMQTVVVGVVSTIPAVFATHFAFDRTAPWRETPIPADAATVIAVWSFIFIVVTTVVSKIIYGLQAQVHEADLDDDGVLERDEVVGRTSQRVAVGRTATNRGFIPPLDIFVQSESIGDASFDVKRQLSELPQGRLPAPR